MSALRARLAAPAGARLVGLYPHAWRARYGEEMRALLEDDPPGARGLGTLVLGAARAHARPRRSWSAGVDAPTRLRLSLSALFCCWIALSLAGIGFQKDTEDPAFAAAAARHPLLGIGHALVLAGACLGAASIAYGGLPLLALAVRAARRQARLMVLLALPALAVVLLAALTVLLVAIAPARGAGFPASFVLSVLLPWTLAIYACALVCAIVPRAVLARVEMPLPSLRRALRAGLVLGAAMWLLAAGMALYAPALLAGSHSLAAVATGPYGASTGVMLCLQTISAALLASVASVSALRGARALRD